MGKIPAGANDSIMKGGSAGGGSVGGGMDYKQLVERIKKLEVSYSLSGESFKVQMLLPLTDIL